MPTAADVLTLLHAEGELRSPFDAGAAAQLPLIGIAETSRATLGELSWVSRTLATAERIGAFRGSLLLLPDGAPLEAIRSPAIAVVCRDVRWAFTRVVASLFTGLSRTRWPQRGDAPIASDAQIAPGAVLAHGVVIGPGVSIGDGTWIGPNTCLAHTSIGARVQIGANCSLGLAGYGYAKGPRGQQVAFPHIGRVIIEDDVEIGSNTCIDRGALGDTRVQRGARIDNLVHVAHNVVVGEDAMVIAHAMLGGSCVIGDRAWVAPAVSVMNKATIGADAVLGLGAVVVKSVPAGATVVGNPARPLERRVAP
jgi:UDP-3-O-[3-hydroxymyristoyl] glucosamine N-acyltransferase